MSRPGIETRPPAWEASTVEKSHSNSLLMTIWNFHIWAREFRDSSSILALSATQFTLQKSVGDQGGGGDQALTRKIFYYFCHLHCFPCSATCGRRDGSSQSPRCPCPACPGPCPYRETSWWIPDTLMIQIRYHSTTEESHMVQSVSYSTL